MQPPHSTEAEQAVLGALLLKPDGDAAADVAEILRADDFHDKAHRLIYRVFERRNDTGEPFDIVSVAENLQRSGDLEDIGGLPYLRSLEANTPGVSNVAAYAGMVRDSKIRRQLLSVLRELREDCHRPEQLAAHDLLDKAERQVLDIGERSEGGDGMSPLADILKQVVDELADLQERRRDDPDRLTGLTTPLPWLNNKTSGLQKTDLVILAGRPGCGKTSMAVNFAEHAASRQDAPVVIFSVEMAATAVTQRMLAGRSDILLRNLRSGNLTASNLGELADAANELKAWPLYIDASPVLTPQNMRHRIRRVVHLTKKHPALVIVDYLQLMQSNERHENRNHEVAAISRALKSLAKEFDCPLLVLSQLSRASEQQSQRRPVLADLRDSGAIEQDADIVLFLHRRKIPEEQLGEQQHGPNMETELIIGKHRNGPTGTCQLSFQGGYTRFREQAHQGAEGDVDELEEEDMDAMG